MTAAQNWYRGPEHAPFTITARSRSAGPSTGALLIHGFMGSPQELRPLGEALAAAGINAHGPLLPGFGSELGAINAQRAEDWVDAANHAWDEIVARYDRHVLLGFSMGGAVAMSVAARLAPDRLVLLAPLWRVGQGKQRYLVPLLPIYKHIRRSFEPFGNSDFDDPRTRQFFQDVDPGLDIDDPEVQRSIREDTAISMGVIDQLRRVSTMGWNAAPDVRAPSLVLQGIKDGVVTPGRTRKLLTRLGGPVSYRELDSDHFIVADGRPSWEKVRTRVVEFAGGISR